MINNIVNILTCIFEAMTIFMFVSTYTKRKEHKQNGYFNMIFVVMLSSLIFTSNRIAGMAILNLILISLSIFGTAFLYNGKIKINIMLSIICVLIFSVMEIFTLFIMTEIFKISINDVTDIETYRILGTILSKLFTFVVLKILCLNHKSNAFVAVKTSYWFLFLIMFISSTIAMYLLYMFQYNNTMGDLYRQLTIWTSFGILYSVFFSLYLYENVIKQADIKTKEQLYEHQIREQARHMDEIMAAQNQIKKIRHDMKNHNIALLSYFENQDYSSGIEYIKKISSEAGKNEKFISTGNTAFDVILNTKKNIAESKGIELETVLQIPEKLFIDSVDICIIFGNALDNAIEACEKIKNGDRKITVSVVYEDNSLICKIENTALNENNPDLKTTKKDKKNHGFGIENIKSSLSKYKNILNIDRMDNKFILSFIIWRN